ncbi:SGNH hydrolase [Trichodelitschia bisporula]|uniref:SGNH hydrolase n=1 Tax=Trichodelitschia bisporula TaxID=703511 RepID=A0A6G1I9Q3_9PEZI|nr:SGNH hydrolase [Trichodelitschia bisporula]
MLLCALDAAAVKLWLAGDSTMAKASTANMQGWGEKLQPLMSLPVVNKAIGGRSARSYTVEGRFAEITKSVAAGDFVVIEFGHNDGGSLSNDNGRTDCPGSGSETCKSTYKGERVTVKTFPAYLIEAGKAYTAKGARVVFSSMTPNNVWEGGKYTYGPGRFTEYARDAAKAVGKGATFVDHGSYTAAAYKALGAKTVNGFYPNDHTHTNAEGAEVVAKAFVKAVVCAKDGLAEHVKSGVALVPSGCL